MHKGAVWHIRARSAAPNRLAAGQTSPAKRASPRNMSASRAPGRVSPRWRHETDASPPSSPLYTHIRHKARIPGARGAGRRERGFDRRRGEPKPRLFRLPAPANAPTSIPPASLSPPNIVAAVIREPAIPAFRDRGGAALRRWGFRGLSAAFDDFGARGMASWIDLDRSVFAS